MSKRHDNSVLSKDNFFARVNVKFGLFLESHMLENPIILPFLEIMTNIPNTTNESKFAFSKA
ncbi:hypothetical protein BpHYR1_041666 [Brachionus plicatilis]|uniref:Uncharacterized protein n=1 Tax=Brachionus plicatilis TaxID=10195 RepID=A0A3M7STF1_BRAPC|nr:hypothetical protein BpHYR1_041666 [Brachionus plicatilis]